jgi:glycerophosphoryl diester phosphodiesterase
MSDMSEAARDRRPVLGFAHRGARLEAPENTIDAFRLALEQGATGLETDCWLSGDGQVVCVHDATVGRGLRRKQVRRTSAADLAEMGVPRLADVYAALGTAMVWSIDAKHDEVVGPLLDVVAAHGARDRLWLCHPDARLLAEWRPRTDAHLVHSRRRDRLDVPIERHAHELAQAGIEAMNFHHTDWSAGLVSLFQRFGVRAFAWDVQEVRHLREMLRIGIDALYCDRPDRLVATLGEWS